MNRLSRRYLWVAFFFITSSLSYAQASFPLSEVTTGLTGYAITAGANNILERFPVEVIAVQQDVGTGFPLVLIKASGPFIESTGGVAAGMSGSPVYLENEAGEALLGAIGYVFPSSDHRLALVTPIEIMRGVRAASLDFKPSGEAFANYGEAVAVATPVLLSGLSERASKALEPLFSSRLVSQFPVQVTGAASWDETDYSLEPGSAISVQLVRGDVTIAAVGTVTEIQGNSVLAFGHPFLGVGEVSLALAPAQVSYIVPSDVVPFKLANNGQTLLGSITQDRAPAIAGVLGLEPDFLPITITLSGEGSSVTKRIEITNDERYYAPLLASATVQIFDEVYQKVDAGTSDVAWDITLSNGTTVRVLEQVTDPSDISSLTARLIAEPLSILATNIFSEAVIERVAINIRYEEQERYAEIVEVIAEQEEINKGEFVTLHIRLQPYRGEPEVKTIRLSLPEEATGSLDIVIRGGMENSPDRGEDGKPILSFAELLAALNGNVESSEIIIETTIEDDNERLERLSFPYLVQGQETIGITILEEESEPEEADTASEDGQEEAPETQNNTSPEEENNDRMQP